MDRQEALNQLQQLGDRKLLELCISDENINSLCRDQGFWKERYVKKFGQPEIKNITNWRNYYLKILIQEEEEETRPRWDTIEESRNYGEGTLVSPDMEFRGFEYDDDEELENASDLLYQENDMGYRPPPYTPIGIIVYHGGKPLSDNKYFKELHPFFVSLNRDDAKKYGPVTTYKITKQYPVRSILWDQLASNYGWDIDLDKYKTWEEVDDAIDGGDYSDEQHEAEAKAHKILSKASMLKGEPLVIGSGQDEEFGFFPSAFGGLEIIY